MTAIPAKVSILDRSHDAPVKEAKVLEINWSPEVASPMMAELAGVDGLDRVAKRSLDGISGEDGLRICVVIGHALRRKEMVPQVTIFAARDGDEGDAIRLECVQDEETSVSVSGCGWDSRRSGWPGAFDRAAEVIREAMGRQGKTDEGGE